MPTATDTRSKTKEAAATLVSRGVRPTARKVRKILGSGSLSTISNELTLLGYASQAGEAEFNLEPAGGVPPFAQAQTALPAYSSRPGPDTAAAISPELTATLDRMANELQLLREELASLRASSTEQLAQAYGRYEAVQRQAMLQIDAARQETAEIRERLRNAGLDAQVREDAVRGQNQHLREENQRLQGMVEALREERVHK